MDADEEKHLVEAAQAGNAHALSRLYQLHVQPIYRYVVARVRDPLIAEDITADVFVRVLETLSQYEQRGLPFLAWLYRIAAGKVVDHYRWSGRRNNQALDESLVAEEASPEQLVSQKLQSEKLMLHLQSLTADQQQVVMLRFIQGYNLQQVAELMGKNEGAIKSLQFRALQTLARLLETDMTEVRDDPK